MRSLLRGAEMRAFVSHQTKNVLWPYGHATRLVGGRSGTKHTAQLSTNRRGNERPTAPGVAVLVTLPLPHTAG